MRPRRHRSAIFDLLTRLPPLLFELTLMLPLDVVTLTAIRFHLYLLLCDELTLRGHYSNDRTATLLPLSPRRCI